MKQDIICGFFVVLHIPLLRYFDTHLWTVRYLTPNVSAIRSKVSRLEDSQIPFRRLALRSLPALRHACISFHNLLSSTRVSVMNLCGKGIVYIVSRIGASECPPNYELNLALNQIDSDNNQQDANQTFKGERFF